MKCPACKDPDLVMSERSGVEIDYCPSCRGVWLDRGELDKILERAQREQPPSATAPTTPTAAAPAPPQQSAPPYQVPPDQRTYRPRDSSDDLTRGEWDRKHGGGFGGFGSGDGRRRKSWLSELFD